MRACPFCAEEIQDAAIVCKHCQRDVAAAKTSTERTAPAALPPRGKKVAAGDAEARRRRNSIGLLVLVLLVLGVVVAASSSGDGSSPASRAVVSAVSAPSVTNLALDKELVIKAGYIQTFQWQATPTQPNCHVSGHIEVTDGGSKDVDVLVMPADDYENFVNGHESKVYFQSGKKTAVTLDVNTGQPGAQAVVVSNGFSVVSDKTVKLTNVTAVCT